MVVGGVIRQFALSLSPIAITTRIELQFRDHLGNLLPQPGMFGVAVETRMPVHPDLLYPEIDRQPEHDEIKPGRDRFGKLTRYECRHISGMRGNRHGMEMRKRQRHAQILPSRAHSIKYAAAFPAILGINSKAQCIEYVTRQRVSRGQRCSLKSRMPVA